MNSKNASNASKNKIIVITGPTAGGKSEVAFEIAKKINAEIISADSRQIYKYTKIGSAQPSARLQKRIKHHLVNFLEPDKIYSAGQFAADAQKIIGRLQKQKKSAIVAGGTGLYIKALTEGLSPIPSINPKIKIRLIDECKSAGVQALYERLRQIDPETAIKIHPNHSSRIVRALEVFEGTGKKISDWHKIKLVQKFDYIVFGLLWNKKTLLDKIKVRSQQILNYGIIKEAKLLNKKGFKQSLAMLKTIGYNYAYDYLSGLIDRQALLAQLIKTTKNYAKRQMTWLKKQNSIIWIEMSPRKSAKSAAREILERYRRQK